jgi:hypothetical protein
VTGRKGLGGLEAVDDVTMVAAADLMAAYERELIDGEQESILHSTQWVVFEPNDDALWAKIRRTVPGHGVAVGLAGRADAGRAVLRHM